MKSIKLRIVKENVMGRDAFFTTYDLLKSAINQPVEGGFGVDEMSKRLKLLNNLEQYKELFDQKEFTDADLETWETIQFEDSDFVKLKELFKAVKWGIVSKTILDLHEEIEKA